MLYLWWGCRGNLTLITLRSERIKLLRHYFQPIDNCVHIQDREWNTICSQAGADWKGNTSSSEVRWGVAGTGEWQRRVNCSSIILQVQNNILVYLPLRIPRSGWGCTRSVHMCSCPAWRMAKHHSLFRDVFLFRYQINIGNRTEWSTIRSVIIRVITKFVNHEYDYRPTSDDTKSHYQLVIKYYNFQGLLLRMWLGDLNSAQIFHWLIQQSDYNCPITCKCPINDLIGGFIDQSDSRKL